MDGSEKMVFPMTFNGIASGKTDRMLYSVGGGGGGRDTTLTGMLEIMYNVLEE